MSGEGFAVEVKTRKTLPAWLVSAMAQAVRNAGDGRLPLVVLHEAGDKHDGDLVTLRLGDFQEWFGDTGVDNE
jgi:hypothetical protein